MVIASLACLFVLGGPQTQGFVAKPHAAHPRGVLVLHAWWGLNGDVKAFCRRLAGRGYLAYAPDMFHGKQAKSRAEAQKLVQTFEAKGGDIQAQIRSAARELSAKTEGKPIAVIGFSFGAYYALWLSNAEPSLIRATAVYYGTGQEDFSKSKSAYLGNFAANDEFEPKAGVDKLAKLLKDAGRPAALYTYPNTGHWFAEPSVKPAYNKAAAELAWTRTLSFLRTNLGLAPVKVAR